MIRKILTGLIWFFEFIFFMWVAYAIGAHEILWLVGGFLAIMTAIGGAVGFVLGWFGIIEF